jgi:hypothetical protein
VVCNKTLKKLKSLTYGTRTKQFFIEAAALNLQFVRLLHSVYYPQLEEGKDWEAPCRKYLQDCALMAGHQAESCAAHDLGEGVEYCVGIDGSTKDNKHVMNANAFVRNREDVANGSNGSESKLVVVRGPTLASKGGGVGGGG